MFMLRLDASLRTTGSPRFGSPHEINGNVCFSQEVGPAEDSTEGPFSELAGLERELEESAQLKPTTAKDAIEAGILRRSP